MAFKRSISMVPRKKALEDGRHPTKERLCCNDKPSFRPALHLNDIQNCANGTCQVRAFIHDTMKGKLLFQACNETRVRNAKPRDGHVKILNCCVEEPASITLAYVYGPFGGVADFRDLGIGNNEELHHTLRGYITGHLRNCDIKRGRALSYQNHLLQLHRSEVSRRRPAGIVIMKALGKLLLNRLCQLFPNHGNRVGSRFGGGGGVAGALETNMDRIHKVSANDAKETQLTITPTHSNVQREVSLKIGLPSENVRDKDTSKERMVIQVHLPQIQADAIPRRRFMKVWEQKREPEQCSILVDLLVELLRARSMMVIYTSVNQMTSYTPETDFYYDGPRVRYNFDQR
ncbi:hypothetical protein EV424DRAFT_1344841 [Suillus variegatus]|nr:hypothetical protein EV424DRAFT_1344841 [Suillus variegatus]